MPAWRQSPRRFPLANRSTSSVEAIFRACNPAAILSTADQCESSKQRHARLPALLERPWIATDRVADDRREAWREPPRDGRHIAFLQYTSGSTSSPKGVMLSHENLLHNAAVIQQAFGNTPEGQGVSWLPLYHDMGLIGGVVQPIYCGGPLRAFGARGVFAASRLVAGDDLEDPSQRERRPGLRL